MATSKKYNYCVFIGRMQPPHKAHIHNIRHALDIADKAIVIFGSHRAARNIKNPWTAQEREEMVKAHFSKEEQERLIFLCVRDFYYNDNMWVTNVQQSVADIVEEDARICLLGKNKDHTSYYLDLFPQWKREAVSSIDEALNATDVRNWYFNPEHPERHSVLNISKKISEEVQDYLIDWQHKNSEIYNKLSEEWKFIQDYKKMWDAAPFPVTFNTTDVVVVKSGHVLMIRRKFNPGKGLLALPGGFVKQNMKIIDSALEELKEETRIRIHKDDIKNFIKDDKVFDHPNRSLRGRTITHAFYIELPRGGDLPQVKADDDAERALWIPIVELYGKEDQVYEDHLHIVDYFYGKAK